jgi:hypothetical protein
MRQPLERVPYMISAEWLSAETVLGVADQLVRSEFMKTETLHAKRATRTVFVITAAYLRP